MRYYGEREGLLDSNFEFSLEDLKKYFYQVYLYFKNKKCFEAAITGIWTGEYNNRSLYLGPLFAPSPEIFFINNLHVKDAYPIDECYEHYTEYELFTVIEMLYNNIGKFNYKTAKLEQVESKKEFLTHINNILRFYKGGYFLESNSGTLAKGENTALKEMLSEDLSQTLEEDTLEKMRTAIRLYYRFDSNLENKNEAINTLAGILESIRKDLQMLLHSELGISKYKHDAVIFNIVNSFNIRHNDVKQKTEYQREIWYDWMIQYYSSVIITYFKIQKSIK